MCKLLHGLCNGFFSTSVYLYSLKLNDGQCKSDVLPYFFISQQLFHTTNVLLCCYWLIRINGSDWLKAIELLFTVMMASLQTEMCILVNIRKTSAHTHTQTAKQQPMTANQVVDLITQSTVCSDTHTHTDVNRNNLESKHFGMKD